MTRASGKQPEIVDAEVEAYNGDGEPYVPRTPLGRRLMEIRAQIVASGQPLLDSWEDLEREVAERRGGTHLNDLS